MGKMVGMGYLEGGNVINNSRSSRKVSKNFQGVLVTQSFEIFLL
jgi:hypothetical protein